MLITQESALREYARMLNSSNPDYFLPLLDEDFIYESQFVLTPMVSKDSFEKYIVAKLATINESGGKVYAEMGTVSAFFANQPCVILAQDRTENIVALVLAKVVDGRLARMDLCIAPAPESASRSSEYPS